MEELNFAQVAHKSIKGVVALISRTFLIQVLGIVAFLIISSRLDPDIFGIYIIAQSVLMFFNYFQDIGLAASLIQKKKTPHFQTIAQSLQSSRHLFSQLSSRQ